MTTTKVLGPFVAAAVLAGCSQFGHYRVPNPERPRVLFTNGYLVVNQEPVVVERRPNEAAVVSWRLAADSGLTFDENGGITIVRRIKDRLLRRVDDKDKPKIACQRGEVPPPLAKTARADVQKEPTANPRAFTCIIAPDAAPGLYEYQIHTLDSTNRRISSDPTMMI